MRGIAIAIAAVLVPAVALAGPGVVGGMNGWNPGDPAYLTTLNGNGVHVLTKTLAAGYYEYKGIETNAWDGNDFPGNNQNFTLAADGDVTWFVNFGATVGVKQGDEFIFDSTHAPIVCGDFMSELGGSDWDNTNTTLTAMADPDGDDVWVFFAVIPAGNYQCKVVLNNNWDQNTAPAGNYSFSSDGTTPVVFEYHMANNVTEISSQLVTLADCTVTFHLCLAGGAETSGDICVTGSHAALTNWGSGSGPMTLECATVSPKLYEHSVLFPAGSSPFVEYKYRKDGCSTWEDGGNHSFNLPTDSTTELDLWVDGWSWVEPDCPPCVTPVEDGSWGTLKAMFR